MLDIRQLLAMLVLSEINKMPLFGSFDQKEIEKIAREKNEDNT